MLCAIPITKLTIRHSVMMLCASHVIKLTIHHSVMMLCAIPMIKLTIRHSVMTLCAIPIIKLTIHHFLMMLCAIPMIKLTIWESRVPDRKISVEGDRLWHNLNRGVSRGLDVKACRPRLISSDLEREVILDSFSRWILTIKCIFVAFWCLTHLYVIPTRY